MMMMMMMMMMIYPSSSLCANIDPSNQHKPRSNCVAKLRSGTSEFLHGSTFVCLQTAVTKLHPITTGKPIKQIFTKFHPRRVSPRIFEKFQFWLKHDEKNGHSVYKDLHTCFSAHSLRVTSYMPCSRITFPSEVAEI
jgi:hypothetical protein